MGVGAAGLIHGSDRGADYSPHGAAERLAKPLDVLESSVPEASEGTPAIQDAWDKVEEHFDFAYRRVAQDTTSGISPDSDR